MLMTDNQILVRTLNNHSSHMLPVELCNSFTTLGNGWKVKFTFTLLPTNSTPRCVSKKNESVYLQNDIYK